MAGEIDLALAEQLTGKGLAVLQAGVGTWVIGLVECGSLSAFRGCHGVWGSLADLSGFLATWVPCDPDRWDHYGRQRFGASQQVEEHVREGPMFHEALCQAANLVSRCRVS